jgi:MFS superfamily sulfate permease-like transporter
MNIRIVGKIEGGLPIPSLDFFDLVNDYFFDLLPTATVIAFVAFMESIAIAKTYAIKLGYSIDPNQELIALGTANFVSSFTQCIPVTGSFSRTIVNAQSNVKSPISNIVTACLVASVVMFFTPLIEFMPTVTLASIVVMACLNLFDLTVPRFLWRVKRADFWVWMIAMSTTIYKGIEVGVLCGAIVSIIRVIKRSATPHWARLGQLRETGIGNQITYRNLERYPNALVIEGIEIIRFDSNLYFANMGFFHDLIQSFAQMEHTKNIIIDCSVIPNIDASAVHGLSEIYQELKGMKDPVNLYFTSVRGPVRDTLDNAGLTDLFGRHDRFFNEIHDAVVYIMNEDSENVYYTNKDETDDKQMKTIQEKLVRKQSYLDELNRLASSTNADNSPPPPTTTESSGLSSRNPSIASTLNNYINEAGIVITPSTPSDIIISIDSTSRVNLRRCNDPNCADPNHKNQKP